MTTAFHEMNSMITEGLRQIRKDQIQLKGDILKEYSKQDEKFKETIESSMDSGAACAQLLQAMREKIAMLHDAKLAGGLTPH